MLAICRLKTHWLTLFASNAPLFRMCGTKWLAKLHHTQLVAVYRLLAATNVSRVAQRHSKRQYNVLVSSQAEWKVLFKVVKVWQIGSWDDCYSLFSVLFCVVAFCCVFCRTMFRRRVPLCCALLLICHHIYPTFRNSRNSAAGFDILSAVQHSYYEYHEFHAQ